MFRKFYSALKTYVVLILGIDSAVVNLNFKHTPHAHTSSHVQLLTSKRTFPLAMHTAEKIDEDKASTKFILTLFQNLLDGHSLTASAQINQGKRKFDEVNTIRSISSQGLPGQGHFKLTQFRPQEKIHHIEFRTGSSSDKEGGSLYVISIKRGNKTVRKMRIRKNKNSHLDLTTFIRPWIFSQREDIFVDVSVFSGARTPPRQKLDRVRYDSDILLIFTQNHKILQELFKIGNVSMNTDSGESHYRTKRSATKQTVVNRKGRLRRRKPCHLANMKVDFNYVGWGQYIIFPKSYNARACKGICAIPYVYDHALTNHAMMQSVMRKPTKGKVPLTCCVPKTLRPLSMLFYEGNEVVVRHHKDMIADDCGCR